jgi:hypothetical protein
MPVDLVLKQKSSVFEEKECYERKKFVQHTKHDLQFVILYYIIMET